MKKDTNVNVRLTSELRAELQRLADADGRKLSSYIDRLLQLHVRGELRKTHPSPPSEAERLLPGGEFTGRRYYKKLLTWEVGPVDSLSGKLSDKSSPQVRLFLTDGARETAIYEMTTKDADRLSTDLYNFAMLVADSQDRD